MQFQIRAMAAPWRRGVELLIQCGRKTAKFSGETEDVNYVSGYVEIQPANGAGLMFVQYPNGAPRESSLELLPQDAQTLMDDLWQAGLRPTEGAGSAGSLAATERHLQDMRQLVFWNQTKATLEPKVL